jgi:hypothetical protein
MICPSLGKPAAAAVDAGKDCQSISSRRMSSRELVLEVDYSFISESRPTEFLSGRDSL